MWKAGLGLFCDYCFIKYIAKIKDDFEVIN